MPVNTATKFNVAPALSVPYVSTDDTARVGAYFDALPYPLDALWVEVKVFAVYTVTVDGVTDTKAAAYWLAGLFRTDANGVLTQVGATASVIAALEDTGGMACTLAVGSPNDRDPDLPSTDNTEIQVTLTGVAATTINWVLDNTIRHAPFTK